MQVYFSSFCFSCADSQVCVCLLGFTDPSLILDLQSVDFRLRMNFDLG